MYQLFVNRCVITAILLIGAVSSYGQGDLPEVFKQETISGQLKYLEEKTRIYENYRAIREDMFRSFSRNVRDTLANAKSRIYGLAAHNAVLDNRIDSLQKSLEASAAELEQKTRTKNSIGILGMEVNKNTYNTVMWTIMAALVFLLITGYLSFKHNRALTVRTKKDLIELQAEYEEYRKNTRIEREKMNIDHFNEIKKLKGR